MAANATRMPGYVYKTAAIREEDYKTVEAVAKVLHLPITQAIGVIVGATGPHLPAAIEAHQAAVAAKTRDEMLQNPVFQALAHDRRRRRLALLEATDEGKEKAGRGVDAPAGV